MIIFNKNAIIGMCERIFWQRGQTGATLYLMGGTKPNVEAANYSTTGYLGTTNLSSYMVQNSDVISISSSPPAFNGAVTGTTTYCILSFGSNLGIVLDVSDVVTPTGHCILLSTSIVSGSPITIVDFGFKLSGI